MLLLAFAKSRVPSLLKTQIHQRFHNSAESTLDFATQNLIRKAQNHRISHEVRKSFCYFWLSPKVESPLPYRLQSTKKGNFAKLKSFCYFLLIQKVESSFPLNFNQPEIPQFRRIHKLTESKIPTLRISHEVHKSFCYFLLSQKVESFLSYRL